MPGFCTVDDVKSVVDTDMSDDEVNVLIDIISAVMTSTLNTGGVDSQILRGICQSWTALRVMLKDPASRSLGQYREDRAKTLDMLWGQVLYAIAHTDGGMAFTAASESLA